MLSLSAKIRKELGREVEKLRKEGLIPAVLYGPGIKNLNLVLDSKEFEKAYKEAGESSLISLEVEGKKDKFLVLIHDIQFDPLTDKPIHVDLYQPHLKEEVEVTVPIILEGESPAVKNLGGTLVKNISEIEIKGLPQDLPKEIRVDITALKTFDDILFVKDLQVPKGVKVLRKPDEILISVSPPEKEEERPEEEAVEEKVSEEKPEDSEEKGKEE